MLRTLSIAATTALSLTALPAAAFDISEMTPPEREAFRGEIRAYLLENPEVLMEAIGVLENRQAAAQAHGDKSLVADNAEALFNDGYSHVAGNPEGDITIVEFTDYRCGYCRKAFPELETLLEADGNIKLIIKEFPILGDQSETSSRFAIAVQQIEGEEAYKKAHDALITMRGEVNDASLTDLANELGFDAAPVLAAMDSDEVGAIIAENRALAQILQISGTPTFILEDEMLRGYIPLQSMLGLVEQARAAK
ncbi:DsbA family protein [Vannielia sp.]|uniref:DsbA family protein n=1 Tax=Vannielia sp. TaxID=2813045 RepID=UPI0026191BB6|nr:DsbA family protein [Vannielia sp.]MDF1873906.1 DsbA family protein [Vannielia sp.]